MTPPPRELDNAEVLLWAKSEVKPFGVIRFETGEVAHLIHGLAICRYSASRDIYRFSCNRDWEVVHDAAPYRSIAEATAAALEKFGPALRWHAVALPQQGL